jgi:molybdenum cofactor cytidylyltransferase
MQLRGQEGAKKIILEHLDDLETISFPQGYIDIDRAEDYQNLKGNKTANLEDPLI